MIEAADAAADDKSGRRSSRLSQMEEKMTDSTPQDGSPQTEPQSRSNRRARRRRWLLVAGIPAAIASALLLPRAFADNDWHPGGFHGFHRFHGHHRHCNMSEEALREHVDRKLGFALDKLDATDEQERAIRAIVAEAIPEMIALHRQGRSLRESFTEALLADRVDREELERVRQEIEGLTQKATTVAAKRLADISEVLTKAQRAEIYELIQAMH
jgi:Spy/CpxP family protein refolding chaperone